MENSASSGHKDQFQPIPFPVRSFGGLATSKYIIYSAPQDSVEVEAETAAEAFRRSGLKAACRIVRHMPGREVLINTDQLLGAETGSTAPSQPGDATPPAA